MPTGMKPCTLATQATIVVAVYLLAADFSSFAQPVQWTPLRSDDLLNWSPVNTNVPANGVFEFQDNSASFLRRGFIGRSWDFDVR
jgi:hypothetical protein